MLVLTRRANQSIMIGHEIVVTVLEVRGDQVRLGIKAPRSIDVHREEIFAQLQQANRDAAQAPKQAHRVAARLRQAADADADADASATRRLDRARPVRRRALRDRRVRHRAVQRVHAGR